MFIKPFSNNKPRFGGGDRRGPKRDGGLRINREIYAQEVRVIDENGKMLGVYSVPQALDLAQQRGLDLIEIVPNAAPPTCKIMDYGKWKYENKKKQVAAKKNQIIVDTKEIQLRPRTEQHDLDTKLRHARRFILDGDKVKVGLRFSGREMSHQSEGMEVLNKFTAGLTDLAIVEAPAKKEGKQVFVIFAPDPIKVKDFQKKEEAAAKAENKEAASKAAGKDSATTKSEKAVEN